MILTSIHITRQWRTAHPKKLISGNAFITSYEAISNLVLRVVITSEAFRSKMNPARHRMVYGLLKEEMAREGGIHALQLRTRTPEEEAKQIEKEKAEKGKPVEGAEVEKA